MTKGRRIPAAMPAFAMHHGTSSRTRGMLSAHRRDPLAAVRVIEREILPRH